MSPRQKPFYIVLILYRTWFSCSWKTSNGNRNCYFDCLLVPFHNLCKQRGQKKRADNFRNAPISLGRPKFCWNFREERL